MTKLNLDKKILSKLDHIRTHLHSNHAVAMIGAGCTFNAELDNCSVVSWDGLGQLFYEKLYGNGVKNEKNISPIKLASQVEAYYDRPTLNTILKEALPDDFIYPGEFHKRLIELPWNDIFTTNYDTLLEKANNRYNKDYAVVTSRNMLGCSGQTNRIIKLHGSFPETTPFIISEEDYRTYPDKFAYWVNTVKQALIENVFCLIGFSGDDPNFLTWIGWIRDVMGDEAHQIYLLTHEKNLHESDVQLLKKRNVDCINLINVHRDYKTALVDVLDYLAEKPVNTKEEQWKNLKFRSNKWGKNLDAILNDLKDWFQKYPGWEYITFDDIENLDDAVRYFYRLQETLVNQIKEYGKKYELLYYISWLFDVTYTPYDLTEWFVVLLLDTFIEDGKLKTCNINNEKMESLCLALLKQLRRVSCYKEFDIISSGLSQHIFHSYENSSVFYYQCALKHRGLLEFEEAYSYLSKWDVKTFNLKYACQKALLLNELGYKTEAEQTLKNQQKKLALKSRKIQLYDDYIDTHIAWLDSDGRYSLKKTQPFVQLVIRLEKYLKTAFSDENPSGKFNEHQPFLFGVKWGWRTGSNNIQEAFVYSHRLLSILEDFAIPLGWPRSPYYTSVVQDAIKCVLKYSFDLQYPISFILRSYSVDLATSLDRSLTRMYYEKENKLGKVFNHYSEIILTAPSNLDEKIDKYSVASLFGCLSNMSVYIKDDDLLFKVIKKYLYFRVNYPELYWRAYTIAPISAIFSAGISRDKRLELYQYICEIDTDQQIREGCWTENIAKEVDIAKIDINLLMRKLREDSIYNGYNESYTRIRYFDLHDTANEKVASFLDELNFWRKSKKLEDISSHLKDSYPLNEKGSEGCRREEIDAFITDFLSKELVGSNFRHVPINRLLSSVLILDGTWAYYDNETCQRIFQKIFDYGETFKENITAREDFLSMTSTTYNLYQIYHNTAVLLEMSEECDFTKDFIESFLVQVKEIMQSGVPAMLLCVKLIFLLEKTAIINHQVWMSNKLEELILSDDKLEFQDALQALDYIIRKEEEYGMLAHRMLQALYLSKSVFTGFFLKYLAVWLENHEFKKGRARGRINDSLKKFIIRLNTGEMDVLLKSEIEYGLCKVFRTCKSRHILLATVKEWETYLDSNIIANDVMRAWDDNNQ